ncbi:hypothetical protein EYS14_16960 [Alteromonadaceae bacterium M269]|nr:hypothetical protein EYS14_16960 [Alteromonadaceae bacterium M269]
MRTKLFSLLIVVSCLTYSEPRYGEEAVVYYFGWNYTTRSPMNYVNIKRDGVYKTKLEIKNYHDVASLKRLIADLDTVEAYGHSSDVDARLVIEFYYNKEISYMVIADRFYLYELGSEGKYKKKMKLMDKIKDFFHLSFDL